MASTLDQEVIIDSATLETYREAIRSVILDHTKYPPSLGDIQVEVIFDEKNDHYELMYSGWGGDYRIHGPVIHVDIRGDKVWIQHDGTRDTIIDTLIERGVPQNRIVLAYKHPEDRADIEGFALN